MVDEAVARRLLAQVGVPVGTLYVKHGRHNLLGRLAGYNNAARFAPWLVLVDLDSDSRCAPVFARDWMPDPAPLMCFRIAVRAVESWLLADRARVATFLGVDVSRVPTAPERLEDPKRAVADLARHSHRAAIRDDMVPRPGSGRLVGPAYTSRLIEFVSDHRRGWRPSVAARSAESLARCLRCLRRVARRRA